MIDVLTVILTRLVYQSPVLLVLLIGIGYSFGKLGENRRKAILAVAGLGLLLAMRLISLLVSVFLPLWIDKYSYSATGIGFGMGALNLANTLLNAVGYGLLLAAIFSRQFSGTDLRL